MKIDGKWLTDKYISLMLLFFPLWTGISGYGDITFSKFAFFAAATSLWLTGLIICAVIGFRGLPRPTAPQWWAMAFMLTAALSAVFSPFRESVFLGSARWDGLFTLLLYGGIFLGVSAYGRPCKKYIHLLGVSCALCCAVAILQLFRVNALGLFPAGYDYYGGGVWYSGSFLGTIGNTNVLAAYLALCVPAFAAYALLSRERSALWLILPAAMGAYVIVRAEMESAMVALLGAALVCGPYLIFRRTERRRSGLIALGISGLIVAAGLIICWFSPASSGTVWEASQILHGNISDSFGSHRIAIWREGLRLFGSRPILGGGPDTFGVRSTLGFSRFVEESGLTISVHIDNAHNEFLGYLVNLGLGGLISYIALCALSLRRWLLTRDKAAAALGCGLVSYLIQSFFGLGLCLVVPLPFILMGLLCSEEEGK